MSKFKLATILSIVFLLTLKLPVLANSTPTLGLEAEVDCSKGLDYSVLMKEVKNPSLDYIKTEDGNFIMNKGRRTLVFLAKENNSCTFVFLKGNQYRLLRTTQKLFTKNKI